jgi:hypothetical protein
MCDLKQATSDVHILIIGAGKNIHLHRAIIADSLWLGVTGLLIANGLKKLAFTHCTTEQLHQV